MVTLSDKHLGGPGGPFLPWDTNAALSDLSHGMRRPAIGQGEVPNFRKWTCEIVPFEVHLKE